MGLDARALENQAGRGNSIVMRFMKLVTYVFCIALLTTTCLVKPQPETLRPQQSEEELKAQQELEAEIEKRLQETAHQTTSRKKPEQEYSKGKITLDPAKRIVIKYRKDLFSPFDSAYQPAELSHAELRLVDSLMVNAVLAHNLTEIYETRYIDVADTSYRRQVIAVRNTHGEKVVWINCLCRPDDDSWKTQITMVMDGGSCYFNLKINLATKKFYDFFVNGVG